MLLASIVLYKIFKPTFNEEKRSLVEDKDKFNELFSQLLTDITSHIQGDVSDDAIRWLKLVNI